METTVLTLTKQSKFCSQNRRRACLGSIASSRTLDCTQVSLSLTSFRPLMPENEAFFDVHGALEFGCITLDHMLEPFQRVSWRGNMIRR